MFHLAALIAFFLGDTAIFIGFTSDDLGESDLENTAFEVGFYFTGIHARW
jgi:hypothetical protein